MTTKKEKKKVIKKQLWSHKDILECEVCRAEAMIQITNCELNIIDEFQKLGNLFGDLGVNNQLGMKLINTFKNLNNDFDKMEKMLNEMEKQK